MDRIPCDIIYKNNMLIDSSGKQKQNTVSVAFSYLSGFPEIVTSKMEFVPEIRNKNIKSDKDEFKVFSNNNENIIQEELNNNNKKEIEILNEEKETDEIQENSNNNIKEESVTKEDGDRIILTFQGESPFILVEESTKITDEMQITPVYGEPTIISDTVAALSDTSINFISGGVEYYIASDSLTKQQIIEVAQSINSLPLMK